MSNLFRELIKKVGSGTHTSESLSREEAKTAMAMILRQEATPAQIGAFIIAHRIKRPTGIELAGMLDAYEELGPRLHLEGCPLSPPVRVVGVPYDGRSRTVPVTILTALLLVAAGVPVILHGGDRMPTKYGLPLVEIWHGLEIDFASLSLAASQEFFEATGLGFVYLPVHFPLAHQLVTYRDEIGKRPPIATAELIWTPCDGEPHLIAGYVHPPTENLFREALGLRGCTRYTTIKGLEGSCDLARNRTAIVGVGQRMGETWLNARLNVHPAEYELSGSDVPLASIETAIAQMHAILQGEPSDLAPSAILNGGFYLWHCGVCASLESGLAQAKDMFASGKVLQTLNRLRQTRDRL